MALLAMRFPFYTPIAASRIYSGGNWFYVRWINAVTHAAQMIAFQPGGHGLDKQFVHYNMRAPHFVAALGKDPGRPVPRFHVNRSRPEPAGYSLERNKGINLDLVKETRDERQEGVALEEGSSRSWLTVPPFTVCALTALSGRVACSYAKLKQVSIAITFTTVSDFYKIVNGHIASYTGNVDRGLGGIASLALAHSNINGRYSYIL